MMAAIYTRVSTKNQEALNQELQLKAYCEKSGYEIFKIYEDVISGKEDARPKYDQLFIDAHKKIFDVVIFWDITRFSRSGTLFTLQKLHELDLLGIQWHSYADPNFSTLGPWKDIIISLLATIGKMEREKISERTKAGLERARAQGKQLGRSRIPDEVIHEIQIYLDLGKSYSWIHDHVSYKAKYGKIKKVSKGKISEIARSWNPCSKKGGQKCNQEK